MFCFNLTCQFFSIRLIFNAHFLHTIIPQYHIILIYWKWCFPFTLLCSGLFGYPIVFVNWNMNHNFFSTLIQTHNSKSKFIILARAWHFAIVCKQYLNYLLCDFARIPETISSPNNSWNDITIKMSFICTFFRTSVCIRNLIYFNVSVRMAWIGKWC